LLEPVLYPVYGEQVKTTLVIGQGSRWDSPERQRYLECPARPGKKQRDWKWIQVDQCMVVRKCKGNRGSMETARRRGNTKREVLRLLNVLPLPFVQLCSSSAKICIQDSHFCSFYLQSRLGEKIGLVIW